MPDHQVPDSLSTAIYDVPTDFKEIQIKAAKGSIVSSGLLYVNPDKSSEVERTERNWKDLEDARIMNREGMDRLENIEFENGTDDVFANDYIRLRRFVIALHQIELLTRSNASGYVLIELIPEKFLFDFYAGLKIIHDQKIQENFRLSQQARDMIFEVQNDLRTSK